MVNFTHNFFYSQLYFQFDSSSAVKDSKAVFGISSSSKASCHYCNYLIADYLSLYLYVGNNYAMIQMK